MDELSTSARRITVVGGGLAGAFAAAALVGAGWRVRHHAAAAAGEASPAAAGLYNVITGREPSLTWRAAECVGALETAFATPLLLPLAPLLRRLPILRPLTDPAAVNDWSAAAPPEGPFTWRLEGPRAGLAPHVATLVLEGCGWLDVRAFLAQLPLVLSATGRYERLDIWFDADAPRSGPIVWANGLWAAQHPRWPARPLQPLKGEVLVVRLGQALDYTLVGGLYLIPRGDGTALLGSTYVPRTTDANPTAAARADLLARLGAAMPGVSVEVIDHWVGIRPTSPDRRPILGHLPESHDYFLTALGTKGVLQAPLLARWLVETLASGRPAWPAEVDLARPSLRLK